MIMSKIESRNIVNAGKKFKSGLITVLITFLVCILIFFDTNSKPKSLKAAEELAFLLLIISLIGSCISFYFFFTAANELINCEIDTTDYSKQIDDNNDEIFEISDDDVKNSEHPYKLYYRLAKIAERKSEINIASENYTKALYHLENDYSHLVKIKNKFEISRQELVSTIEEKLEELNQNK